MFSAIVLTVCYIILYGWSIVSIRQSINLKRQDSVESPEQFFTRQAKEMWLATPMILATALTSFVQVVELWAEVL